MVAEKNGQSIVEMHRETLKDSPSAKFGNFAQRLSAVCHYKCDMGIGMELAKDSFPFSPYGFL